MFPEVHQKCTKLPIIVGYNLLKDFWLEFSELMWVLIVPEHLNCFENKTVQIRILSVELLWGKAKYSLIKAKLHTSLMGQCGHKLGIGELSEGREYTHAWCLKEGGRIVRGIKDRTIKKG